MQAIDPNLNAALVALIDEGNDLFNQGNHRAALVVYLRAFHLHPGRPVVLFNIGRAMEELKDSMCEHFYLAAASQGSTDAFYQLAILYVTSGRLAEAVEPLRGYLKGNPDEEDACTAWVRYTLQKLSPEPGLRLVWKNPGLKKLMWEIPSLEEKIS